MKSLVESTGRAEVGRTSLLISVPPLPTTKQFACLYIPHVLLYPLPRFPKMVPQDVTLQGLRTKAIV